MDMPYRNVDLSIEERTEDLLGRMTLAEKVGQMLQADARGNLQELVQEKQVGSLLHVNGERANEAIDLASGNRLGIPLLIGDDCIHGHSFWRGATIFPTQLGMACSWNEALIEESAVITAREVSSTGVRWTFSPVLCLTRDLRWGRVGETFGEDPTLITRFGTAMIRGYQGKGLDDPQGILATAKHYAGYSETQGGRDASEADISRRKLRSYFLPPFEAAARAGCMSFMTGYQSMGGLPSTANPWLLQTVLRKEWGYEGLLVTDWDNVGRMVNEQRICADMVEAAILAVRSGNDLIMATASFREGAIEAVESGRMGEAEIDAVVRRILRLKFRMGLFEDPGRSDPALQTLIGCAEHRDHNLKLTRESVVLLQNRDRFLPLSAARPLKIALVGPNADNPQTQLGDWAGNSGQMGELDYSHPRECTITVRDGLERCAPDTWSVHYAQGCAIENAREDLIDAAVDLARNSDVVVAVVGDDMPFIGEYKSTGTLEMQGAQISLLEALVATGKPLVVVLINSKPLVLPKCVHGAAAILEAFNPGMMGGQAIAEIISGKVNPSGKLTVSIPYHVGQQPVYYSQVCGQHGDRYADITQSPHFAFGEGLGYTEFELSNLRITPDEVGPEGEISCEVTVGNVGKRAGKTVVQLYISDRVTSATWVQKELKTFQKVELEPGQTVVLTLRIPVSACSLVNLEERRVVEPGWFDVEVGFSSRDPNALRGAFRVE